MITFTDRWLITQQYNTISSNIMHFHDYIHRDNTIMNDRLSNDNISRSLSDNIIKDNQ